MIQFDGSLGKAPPPVGEVADDVAGEASEVKNRLKSCGG